VKRLIATSPAVLGGIAAVTLVAGAGAAIAAWRVQSDEVVLTAETATLSPGNKPAVRAAGNLVTVSWTPNTFGERKVDSYRIQRYDLAGSAQQPLGTCEENVAKESCTDSGVPTGSWRYTVVPVKGGWTGPESAKSDAVIVAADGKAVVIPDPAVDKTAGPAAGPAVVRVGDPASPGDPAATPAPGSPPAWTLQPGADGVLGTDDTLTYAGGTPVDPNDVIKGWNGDKRPVTVVAEAGEQPVLTVDDGATRVFGPLAVPGPTVPANLTFDAKLAGVDGRIVVTLGAVRVAPDEAATAPAAPTEGTNPTAGTPPETPPAGIPDTPATETADPAEPDSTPSTTESAPGAGEPAGADQPGGGGSGHPGPTTGGGAEGDPATDAATTGTPAAEVSPSTASSDAAVVLVAA
jgi:hypothetical protein